MTMQAKYTPGPHRIDEGAPDIYVEWGGKRVVLATVHIPAWHEDLISGVREAYANAMLYAAATEMLEALQQIAKPEGPYSRDPLTHAVNVIEHMASIAERAIARTAGQES